MGWYDDDESLGPSPAHPIEERARVGNCTTCWGAAWHDGPCKKRADKCSCHTKSGKKRKKRKK